MSDINSIGPTNLRSGWRVGRISGGLLWRDGGAWAWWLKVLAGNSAPRRSRHRSHSAHTDEAPAEPDDAMVLLNILLLTAFLILLAIAVAEIRDTHAAASPRRNTGYPAK